MELTELGWNDFFEAGWNSGERMAQVPARVIAQHRELWEVAGAFDSSAAEVSGKLRLAAEEGADWPAVGDWVAVSGSPGQGLAIREVLPRRTQMVRKVAGRRVAAQVLAANVDTLLVIMGLDNDYKARRVERYMVQCWDTGARVVVVLNKADLCPDADARADELRRTVAGVDVVCISAARGQGLAGLDPYLTRSQTVVLLGSSGVGKSTLLNRLSQAERQETAPVRAHDSRGRHTTTARQLFFLPGGAMVIDTPGLRELQLWDADEGLAEAFTDVAALAERCRFRNCTHTEEPGCAVIAGIARGELDAGRFENYQKLLREQTFLQRKMDKGMAAQAKEQWKAVHRTARKEYRRRNREGK